MSEEFLFVYGTLRRRSGAPARHILDRYCEYFAEGRMQGKLFEVAGYPGAVESACRADIVRGEIYSISAASLVLFALDEYEQCSDAFPDPREYIRKKLSIAVTSGQRVVPAWVYVFNHTTANLGQITGGDYLQFLTGSASISSSKPEAATRR